MTEYGKALHRRRLYDCSRARHARFWAWYRFRLVG